MADEDTTVHPTNEEVRAFHGLEEVDGQLVSKATAGALRGRKNEPVKPDDGAVHPTSEELRKAYHMKEVGGHLVHEDNAEAFARHLEAVKAAAAAPSTDPTVHPTNEEVRLSCGFKDEPAVAAATQTRIVEAGSNPAAYRTRRTKADSE